MRKHRFEPHKQEIANWLAEGRTFKEIENLLFMEYEILTSESELCIYAKKHSLRNLIENGRHSSEIPKCKGCENYFEVGVKHLRNGHKNNIRVCKACLEAIPNNVEYSPIWCSKRNREGVITQ